MRIILAAALALAALPAMAKDGMPNLERPQQIEPGRVPPGVYSVDAAHTQVAWSLDHMGFTALEGMFGASGGSLTIDPAQPADAKLEVTFEMVDLSVTFGPFGDHLKSADFFDVERFPKARFVSTSVTPGADRTATITGDLTIKDRIRPVTIKAAFVGAGINPITKLFNLGFRGETTISRNDFGVEGGVPAVPDEVKIRINAAFQAP